MKLIQPVFAQGSVSVGVKEPAAAVSNIGDLISGLVTASIVLGALAAFVFLIIGGFQWITSGGDKTKTEQAQKYITNAIIGLIIIAAAYALINVVTQFLGIGSVRDLTIPSIKQ